MKESFFNKVYDITRKIPYGKVTSYGAIARLIGTKSSARMVGWALNKSGTEYPPVPAHRVVNRLGLLTGKMHFPNLKTMQELLESEGIKIENNTVVNFTEVFWKPE
jgi:methylated-DNA-protein-cysteine methyltransferase-like protein